MSRPPIPIPRLTVEQVTAGSNCWVTFSTTEPGGQVRSFRVDVPSSAGGTTNIILISTNIVFDQNIGTEVDGYTQGVYSVRLGDTNYFRMLIGGEAYGIMVYSNKDGIILSNLYPNVFWFTNPVEQGTRSNEVAGGAISNNYNVDIVGLLTLRGHDTNSTGGVLPQFWANYYTNPFIEFRTTGRNWSNSFVGRAAGVSNTNGYGNTFVGYMAGHSNYSGYWNTFVGSKAGSKNKAYGGSTAVGSRALENNDAADNTAVGADALQANTSGSLNTAVGRMAMQGSLNGAGNTAVGDEALAALTSGYQNVAVGQSAMANNNGGLNVGIGRETYRYGDGSNNIAIGTGAAMGLVGVSNVFVGPSSGRDTLTGINNTGLGASSGIGTYYGNWNTYLGALARQKDGLVNFTMYSNIVLAAGGRHKAWFDGTNDWWFEPTVSTPMFVRGTNGMSIGYPTMTPHTNYAFLGTVEDSRVPATNVTFRFLIPTNVVSIIYTNPALLAHQTWPYSNIPYSSSEITTTRVYGVTGDALIDVPFYTASASTNAPAWNEFVTRNYVDTHSAGFDTNSLLGGSNAWTGDNTFSGPTNIFYNWTLMGSGSLVGGTNFFVTSLVASNIFATNLSGPIIQQIVGMIQSWINNYTNGLLATNGDGSFVTNIPLTSLQTNGGVVGYVLGFTNNGIGWVTNGGGGGGTNFVYENYGFATTNQLINTSNGVIGFVEDWVTNQVVDDNYVPRSEATDLLFNSGGDINKAGLNSAASGNSVAIGPDTYSSDNSLSVGNNSKSDQNAISIGYNSGGSNDTIAIGHNVTVNPQRNIGIGFAAVVPVGFSNTVQLATGTATSNEWLHFRAWPYFNGYGFLQSTNIGVSNVTGRVQIMGNVILMTNNAVSAPYTNQMLVISNSAAGFTRIMMGTNAPSANGLYIGTNGYIGIGMKPANPLDVSTGASIDQYGQFVGAAALVQVVYCSTYKDRYFNNTRILMQSGGVDSSCSNNVPLAGYSWGTALTTNLFTLYSNGIAKFSISSNGSLSSSTFEGPAYSTSTSTSSPAATEFVVAEWVRGLFINGFVGYNSSNAMVNGIGGSNYTTNFFEKFGGFGFVYSNSIPDSFTRVYSAVTNNEYLGAATITNLTQIQGPVIVSSYIGYPSGGGRSLTVKPEIYYTYGTNGYGTNELKGDWEAGSQTITAGATNRYDWVVSVPLTVSTGGVFTLIRTFKVTAQTATPNVSIGGGTNWPSQLSYNSVMSPVGQTVYASNVLSGGALGEPVKLSGSFESNTCGVATFDFSKPRQFTNTTTDVTFSAVTGQHAVDVRTVALTITNSSNTGIKLLTIPGTWTSTTNVYPVTNVGILSVESWGTYMTNAVYRGLK